MSEDNENCYKCPFRECWKGTAPLSRKDFEYHLINKHGIQKEKVSEFIMDNLDKVFSDE